MFKTNSKSFFSAILIQYIWDGAQQSALPKSTLGFLLILVFISLYNKKLREEILKYLIRKMPQFET